MKYDIDNVFSWAKDYSMQKQLNEGMFIDTFIDDIISTEELEDVELEELNNIFNELVKLSSFTSRMRIKIGDIIALKIFEEMEEE